MSILKTISGRDNFYKSDAGEGEYITVVANDKIAASMEEEAIKQACCARHYPGVESVVLTPDAHVGYGVSIGSVVATKGTIFPYLVGSDIACGMRLVKTDLEAGVIADKAFRERLVKSLAEQIPTGSDCHPSPRLNDQEMRDVIRGKFYYDDVRKIERGDLQTDIDVESGTMYKAQYQLGTLGSSNHFYELQVVSEVDDNLSKKWGLWEGQLVIMIHSGSRRVGYDICARFHGEIRRYCDESGIVLPNSFATYGLTKHAPRMEDLTEAQEVVLRKFGEQYVQEMYHANNFAVANRHWMQEAAKIAFKKNGVKLKGFELLYDISHNIAALEDEKVIIRKGATRAFPKGHSMLKGTDWYETGHPIILPGSMDSCSYIMVGTQEAAQTNYSINHGAGRTMSRTHARNTLDRKDAKKRMKNIMANYDSGELIEESKLAYKDINEITDSVVGAGIAKVVAKVEPLCVLKGKNEGRRKRDKSR